MTNRSCWITTILCLATTTTILALVTPTLSRCRSAIPPRPQQLQQHHGQWSNLHGSFGVLLNMLADDEDAAVESKNNKSQDSNILQTIWKRMDTLEAAGLNDEFAEYPPLVSRGGGFKRFMIIMAVGMAYKWYRARFINKIPFWEKQPQWNMVVTTKEQEDALRAYTCRNCGATLFIARNREWFFEGGTGLAGLGCYSCGAKGKDNFVMDRERIVEEVGDEDDYFAYERPLDFVSAAERKALLKATKGDEAAANQILVDQQNASADPAPPPIFGVLPEEIEAKDAEVEDVVESNEVVIEEAEDTQDFAVEEEQDKPDSDEVPPSDDLD